MGNFTGRPTSGRFKKFAGAVLDGLSEMAVASAENARQTRIAEIDKEVRDLLQERDHLIVDLVEPGDLKVSENYDPYWTKPTTLSPAKGEGRLAECDGRSTMSVYSNVHPGCPYKDTIHNSHEFTLRD